MTNKVTLNAADITAKISEMLEIVKASDRAIRGFDGEIGLSARVDKLEITIEDWKNERNDRDKENRSFYKSMLIIGISELVGLLITIGLWATHIRSTP